MKIVIPGGSGQLGTMVSAAFHHDGHEVVVLSRTPRSAPWRVEAWDGRTVGDWVRHLEGAHAVLNLAGRSVNCRYNARNRREILDSRVDSTRAVAEGILRVTRPPRVWLQASTATIYAHTYDAAHGEANGILGGHEDGVPESWRFSINVATAWETEIDDAVIGATRKVKLRSAVVMSPHRGGVFDTLLGLVRRGLGGRAGDGRQFVSWIHDEDFLRALYWLIHNEQVEGTVNLSSPEPLPNADFMREIREAWGAVVGLPAAGWMLELGAAVLRTETELLLKSRKVVPERLLRSGFTFRHPSWPDAARDLCLRWREARRRGLARTERGPHLSHIPR